MRQRNSPTKKGARHQRANNNSSGKNSFPSNSSYVEARRCVRQNVKDPKLAKDMIEVAEAALTCGSWKFEETRSYFACLRRNIKDPKLADITIEGVKNEMKEQLDDL